MAKIILTTGGTGGHIFPALAVAEALQKHGDSHEILFMGSNYGPERRICERAGIKFEGLPVRGFLGRGLKAIPAAFDMGAAIIKASGIISRFAPDAMAGFGGYASFAPVLAAAMKKIPILLHEQNAIAGASNKFLSRFADKICVSLPNTAGFIKNRVVVTGNPIRACVSDKGKRDRITRGSRNLLVLGGSQGAHALNMFMPKILGKLENVDIHHQTGERDLEATREAYEKYGRSPQNVSAFIDDMEKEYEWADVILCRSGASTVAEICAAGLPAVLVPFPAAIHDHQTFNARILEQAGAAALVPEANLDVEKTSSLLNSILNDPARRRQMSEAAIGLARPDAAENVANAIDSLCRAH